MTQSELGAVCDVIMGQAPKGSSYNTDGKGWPLIAGAGDFDGYLARPSKYTTQPTRLSKPGDVLLGIRASIGARAVADTEVCLGRGVAALRPGPELESRYLWHWLGYSSRELAAKGRGATFKQVNKNDVSAMVMALPPLDEQRRIARVLDAADALRAKRREAIKRMSSLPDAILAHHLGSPVEGLAAIPMRHLREVAQDIRIGPFGTALHRKDYVEGGIPVINPMHISSTALQLTSKNTRNSSRTTFRQVT